MSGQNWPVKADRIAEDVEALARITDPDRPWTRRAFTPRFLEGRAYIEARMRAAGLETRIDAAGNLIGRRAGSRPGTGTLLIGSHSDTVPDGGRFDGVAGVVSALEVARSLADAGIVLEHDLEVIDFLAEEVSIFGVSCVGSRAMAGRLDPAWLGRVGGDLTLAEGIRQVGGDPDRLADAARSDIKAFIELHIEQGPVLEDSGDDIGVVSAIVGITRIEFIIEGRPDHAGTTPMAARRDALVAAADLVRAVRALAMAHPEGEGHFTATVGEFRVLPNAANVVPSKVELLIDARAECRPAMEAFIAALTAEAATLKQQHGVVVTGPRVISDNDAVTCDIALQQTLAKAADALGLPRRELASGAGHDAAWIARVAPAAMVFIPCREGRSHTPEEWTENDAIAKGAAVIHEAIRRLDKVGADTAS
ncbi:Zn-dependent hydrolase [Chelatococcus asaccharovorans]|uniref:N-carbamoyl-L-amino-acid hydrolase n=1 Tax=Chelatococcus asaccharovorans TaxID=28210 RepID=A0A2V3TTW8_9HYPH|nr:Zn-dependent hydrolase [Chelatococcus asaccharovorans]MBS7704995.1 Zn-dependent hydrolase [Chelatococcus asaccharovorans]PXW51910.1 N-carbamoyl-L-amino-acid hydrolase [Chelatococcus asaccharovorans]